MGHSKANSNKPRGLGYPSTWQSQTNNFRGLDYPLLLALVYPTSVFRSKPHSSLLVGALVRALALIGTHMVAHSSLEQSHFLAVM